MKVQCIQNRLSNLRKGCYITGRCYRLYVLRHRFDSMVYSYPLSFPSQWPYFVTLVVVMAVLVEAQTRRRRLNLPPGPSPLPLIGNAFSMPRKHLGVELRELCRKYGEVVHLDVLGQHLLVIGSIKVARDLLEKRSANYSDRMPSIMAKLCVML